MHEVQGSIPYHGIHPSTHFPTHSSYSSTHPHTHPSTYTSIHTSIHTHPIHPIHPHTQPSTHPSIHKKRSNDPEAYSTIFSRGTCCLLQGLREALDRAQRSKNFRFQRHQEHISGREKLRQSAKEHIGRVSIISKAAFSATE